VGNAGRYLLVSSICGMTSKLTSFGHKRSSSAEQDCIPAVDDYMKRRLAACNSRTLTVGIGSDKYAARWWG
jgi:hypothetical protein